MAKKFTANSQKKIHAQFADLLYKEEKAEFSEALNKAKKENSEFVKFMSAPKPSNKVSAIQSGNVDICREFYLNDEVGEAFDYQGEPEGFHARTPKENVELSLDYYYKVFENQLDEKKESSYKTDYEAIKKALESYFSRVAEDCLEDYYKDKYVSFKTNYLNQE